MSPEAFVSLAVHSVFAGTFFAAAWSLVDCVRAALPHIRRLMELDQ
jgi:hypothetical protein